MINHRVWHVLRPPLRPGPTTWRAEGARWQDGAARALRPRASCLLCLVCFPLASRENPEAGFPGRGDDCRPPKRHVKPGRDVPTPRPSHGLGTPRVGIQAHMQRAVSVLRAGFIYSCQPPDVQAYGYVRRGGEGAGRDKHGGSGKGTGAWPWPPQGRGRTAVVPAARSGLGFAVRAVGSTSWACP